MKYRIKEAYEVGGKFFTSREEAETHMREMNLMDLLLDIEGDPIFDKISKEELRDCLLDSWDRFKEFFKGY